jgi:ABC-type nitrate/sulfonate/bicarbonate transport system substrate-binding protein
MNRLRWVGGMSLLLTLVLVAPGYDASRVTMAAASGRLAPVRSMTLWLDWQPNSDHVGIYVAMAKGYYARQGLAVQARVPSGAADALQLVAHGTGDMAISYEPDVLLARAQGVPVVATAAIVQRPLNCIMALRSSDITRPRQLQGKTVGIAGLASDYAATDAVVRYDGGNPKLVKKVVVNYALLQALLKKRVDAVEGVFWTWEALQAKQLGYPVNVMHLERYGVPVYDELVFATATRQLQHEAATLRAFQRATFEGYAYAVEHPAEATQILLRMPGVQGGLLSSSRALIEHSIRLLSPIFHDKQGHYGTMSVAQWQAYADWMTRTHLMSKHGDARSALTTALLP